MNTQKETNKHIVSKGEYAQVQGKRMGLRQTAGVFYLVFVFFALNAASCVLTLLLLLYAGRISAQLLAIYFVMFLLTSTGAHFFRKWGKASMHRVRVLNNVIPLTRANQAL